MNNIVFIPGLFATPASAKGQVLGEALHPFGEMKIVDFTALYTQPLDLQKFIDQAGEIIRYHQPAIIVTYSFGSVIYNALLNQRKIPEPEALAMIVPLGNYLYSKNGQSIIFDNKNPARIYAPIREMGISDHVSADFFKNLSICAFENRHVQHKKPTLTVSGSLDADVDRDADHNGQRGMIIHDTHQMKKSMPVICDTVTGFASNYVLG